MDLDNATVNIINNGQADRDQVRALFAVGYSIFVGQSIDSLILYVADQDPVNHSVYTGIGAALAAAALVLVGLYRLLGIKWGQHYLLFAAWLAIELLEVLVVLLVLSAINQFSPYASRYNVIINWSALLLVVLIDLGFKKIKDLQIDTDATNKHMQKNAQLTEEEARASVEAFIASEERKQRIYPMFFKLFSMKITDPSPSDHLSLLPHHTTHVSAVINARRRVS